MSTKAKTGSADIVIQANRRWLAALPGFKKQVQAVALAAGGKCLTIRFAEDAEVAVLNRNFRGKHKPTNVLSFPGEDDTYQGDVILARGVVFQEAASQKKPPLHHTLHLVAHGVLHLLGYDHMNQKDATRMESREIALLQQFGIRNPYA